MPYDDLPLSRSTSSMPPPAPPASSTSRWIIIVATVIVAAGALYFWWTTRIPARLAGPTPTAATDGAVGSNRPSREPIQLPSLSASDALVRQLVSTLSQHPQLARLLATDGLISAAVLTVEQIGDGKTPIAPLKVLRPTGRIALTGGDNSAIDPASYSRWDSDIYALNSVRPGEAAQLYVNLKPLFDEAYAELGHPNGDFDQSLVRALRMLQSTPEPAAEPLLFKRPSYFEHVDATLRALRPVQKQFLLLGAERRARVRSWLTDFAATLDLKIPQ